MENHIVMYIFVVYKNDKLITKIYYNQNNIIINILKFLLIYSFFDFSLWLSLKKKASIYRKIKT